MDAILYDTKKYIYLASELLLKLSYKPHMNLSETFTESVRNMDDNGLSVSRNINLTAKQTITLRKLISIMSDNQGKAKRECVFPYTAELM